jgi:hypothetical protein
VGTPLTPPNGRVLKPLHLRPHQLLEWLVVSLRFKVRIAAAKVCAACCRHPVLTTPHPAPICHSRTLRP